MVAVRRSDELFGSLASRKRRSPDSIGVPPVLLSVNHEDRNVQSPMARSERDRSSVNHLTGLLLPPPQSRGNSLTVEALALFSTNQRKQPPVSARAGKACLCVILTHSGSGAMVS